MKRFRLVMDGEIVKTSDKVETLVKYVRKECFSSEGNIFSYWFNNLPTILDSKYGNEVENYLFWY